jgi:hypothetical protein
MVAPGLWLFAAFEGGSIMRRAILIAVAGALGGCSSFSMDAFKAAPPTVQVQLESIPPGADALTSVGPGCKTPCAVAVAAPEGGFSVTYTLNKFQPVTVPVQVVHVPAEYGPDSTTPASTTLDPNPVIAELKPAGPPPKPARKKQAPKQPKSAVSASAKGSPFPDPSAPTTR